MLDQDQTTPNPAELDAAEQTGSDQSSQQNSAEGTGDAAPETPEVPQPPLPETPVVQEPPAPIEAVVTAAPVVVEVKAPEAPAAPVVQTTQAKTDPEVLNTEAKALEGFDALIAELKATGTSSQKALISSFEQYAFNMQPGKPMDSEKGAKHQYTFWKTIQHLVENSPEGEFNKLWSILLAYAHQHKSGVFGERYIMRFTEQWRQSEDELAAYQRIINLIKLTADPQTRAKNMREVNISRTLELVFSEQGRQRVGNFYA